MKVLLLSCLGEGCLSIKGERFYDRMIKALSSAGLEGSYHPLYTKAQLLNILHLEQPDIVYCADHHTTGDSGEPISIQAILDEVHIPYIGSTSETLDLVLSKSNLKAKWRLNNLPTPPFALVRKSDSKSIAFETIFQSTSYPYILKPNREGNSRGLFESSIIFDQISLESNLVELFKHYDEILVEKYLGSSPDFQEFTVAMIGNNHCRLLMPAELTLKQKKTHRIITTEDKEKHNTKATPVIEMELKREIISLAERAFDIAGVLDYSRCDVIFAGGHLYAIEINGQPMIPDKWFEVCASGIGLDSTQYLNAIFLAGIVRNNHQGKSNLTIPLKMNQHLPKSVLDVLLKP